MEANGRMEYALSQLQKQYTAVQYALIVGGVRPNGKGVSLGIRAEGQLSLSGCPDTHNPDLRTNNIC